MAKRITVEQLKAMDQDMLTPAIVAKVIGCDPYGLTMQVRQWPDRIPFPFIVLGNRTKFPRLALIRWMEGLPQEE